MFSPLGVLFMTTALHTFLHNCGRVLPKELA